jgi:hypothetical protein
MTKSKASAPIGAEPKSTSPSSSLTGEHPGAVRAILWQIASDPEQSATARVSACALLLRHAREHDGGDTVHDAALNRRALALMASARRAN